MILNRKNEAGSVLDFYNVKEGRMSKRFLAFGRGHDEVLHAKVEKGGKNVLLVDMQGRKIFRFDIDSLLSNKSYTYGIIKNDFFTISSLCEFNNKIVALNPFTFSDESANIRQDCGPKVVDIRDLSGIFGKDHEFNTINVASSGELISSADEKTLVLASSGQSVIDMFDKELKHYKRLLGPIELKSKYYISEEKEVVYSKKVPYAYMQSCCNDKYFYLYFVGDYWYFDQKTMDGHNGYVLKFDWKGNHVKTYMVDSYVYSLSCNKFFSEKDTLYATVNDGNGMPMLIKLCENE